MSHATAQSVPQTAPAAWGCPTCGGTLQSACATLLGAICKIDAELVIHRLEAAGATLLAMRCASPFPASYRSGMPDVLQEAIDAYGWTPEKMRPAIPGSAEIDAMDRTLAWLGHIDRPVLRRIVAARALVNPITGLHVVHWMRLAVVIHTDNRTLHRWHAAGIAAIVERLRA